MIRCLVTFFLFSAVLSPGFAYGKRIPAPKVEPVVCRGVRFTAPNDNGRRAYVQAWDRQTNQKLWEVTVSRTFIKPWLEECLQHVFIEKLSIEDGKLLVTAERDHFYSVAFKARTVRKLKRTEPP